MAVTEKQNDKIDFDSIWEKHSHISVYQIKLLIYASSFGFVGGIWTLFPVFGFHSPPFKCLTESEFPIVDQCQVPFISEKNRNYCQGLTIRILPDT